MELIKKTVGQTKHIKLRPMKLQNGVIYDGQWLNGQRDGVGEQLWMDGSKYIGQFRDDKSYG